MRKLVISAAIIGLIASIPPSFAQDREHRDQANPPHGEQRGPQNGGAPRGPQPHGGAGPRPAAQAAPERGEMRGPQEARPNRPAPNTAMRPNQPPTNGPANAMRGQERPTNAMRGPNNGPRPDFNRPNNGPNNAMRGPRRDFSSVRNFHQNFRAPRRFHAPAYRRPPGWYARTWAWGQILPAAFWPRDYWITDFNIYDLPPPPFGAIWVRVGNDALLIDQDSGEIIEVDYGIFY